MTAPKAVIRAAVATRRGDDPALVGTRAVPRHCRSCGRAVIAGYDAPVMGGLAVTDPYALTPLDEAAAVILAWPTWWLAGPWPSWAELVVRHRPELTPIGTRPRADKVTVVAEHRCQSPPLGRTPIPLRRPHASGYPPTPPF